ncbi:hypothetical protein [Streptomyces sp. NPDC096311]|uniref:hypothetical protein n=1 Tax=Streptomyces sp. NPDC096311 TaxID=3366083 RepID=UPI0037FA2ABC
MAPISRFAGQVHRLPYAPEAYGAMITRAKAAPPQSRYIDLHFSAPATTPERQRCRRQWNGQAGIAINDAEYCGCKDPAPAKFLISYFKVAQQAIFEQKP